MFTKITAFLLCAGLSLGLSVAFAKDHEPLRCENCGMLTENSSTHVVASITIDGKTADHEFVCVGCLHEKLEEWEDTAELEGFKVLDYSTYGTDKPKMIDGMSAWYLFGTEVLEDSMDPFAAAFANKATAIEAQKTIGGELVQGWDEVLEAIEVAEHEGEEGDKAGEAHEGHHHADASPAGDADSDAVYVCPCTGGCCDDITSDKPGECPRCGMTLVLKSDK